MPTELRKSFDFGFKLTEEKLWEIYGISKLQMERIIERSEIRSIFKLRFKNNDVQETDSLDEVLSKENSGDWAIRSLTITLDDKQSGPAIPYDTTKSRASIVITFDADARANPINYHVTGENKEWMYLTISLLERRIAKVKTFSPFSHIYIRTLSFVVVGLIIPIIPLIINLLSFKRVYGISLSDSITTSILSVLILAVVSIVTGIFLFPSYFFPSYNFYWGASVKAFNRWQAITKLIIYSMSLAIALSIIAILVANYLILTHNL